MGRGDKQQYYQQEGAQLSQDNNLLQQQLAQRQSLSDTLLPQLQDILAHPGYSDADKASMLGATQSALGGAFGDAAEQMADRAARTGNDAGSLAAEEEMGREKAQTMAQSAGQLSQKFADTALQQRALALSGLNGLYSQTTPLLDSALGSETSLIGDQSRLAAQPGFGSQAALAALHGAEDLGTMGIG